MIQNVQTETHSAGTKQVDLGRQIDHAGKQLSTKSSRLSNLASKPMPARNIRRRRTTGRKTTTAKWPSSSTPEACRRSLEEMRALETRGSPIRGSATTCQFQLGGTTVRAPILTAHP
jgi:hypothetical protein